MKITIIGSGGGPQPNTSRSAPSVAIEHRDKLYVIDCGNGTPRNVVAAGYRLKDLTAVFLTHHHIDHNADFGNLALLAWTAGLVDPIETYGPAPMAEIVDRYVEMNSIDIAHREQLGRPAFRPLVKTTDVAGDGVVYSGDDLTVTAAAVVHPPLEAYAYRFDSSEGSVVISGDTTYCDEMVDIARGADILVHEAFLPDSLHLLTDGSNTKVERLQKHFAQAHTTAEDAGRVAQQAGVKKLVLWHLIPTEGVDRSAWIEQAQRHFSGEVIVSADLDCIRPRG